MKLNSNSFTAKVYRWFNSIHYHSDMPSNLCPYFWKLLFMWLVIIPYVALTLPVQIITKFDKKTFGESIAYTVIFYAALFALVVLATLPISFFTTFADGSFWCNMLQGSILFWIVIVAVALYYGIGYLIERLKEGRKLYDDEGWRYYGVDSEGYKIYHKTKKPSIVVEFIKAKYNKYCPQIEWTDEKNND